MAKQNDGTVTVRIGAFPGGKLQEYTFPAGTTYKDGLKGAKLAGVGERGDATVRVNGQQISSFAGIMQNNDQILAFTNVRGNRT